MELNRFQLKETPDPVYNQCIVPHQVLTEREVDPRTTQVQFLDQDKLQQLIENKGKLVTNSSKSTRRSSRRTRHNSNTTTVSYLVFE